jgi:transcriptional regulator with XRE-family HTH domain
MKIKRPILRIKELMQIKELSREDLAERVAVSVTTISNICSESNYPKVELLPIIAEALGVDIRELFIPTKSNVIGETELIEARDLIEKGLKILKAKK